MSIMKNKQYVITSFSRDISTAAEIVESDIELPSAHQVLIKHKYIGINAVYDRELYRGAVPYINVTFPYVFGVEAIGEVIAVGEKVSHFKVGDAAGTVKVGTAYQEYQLIAEAEAISFPQATAEYLTLSPTGVSALLAIDKLADVSIGDTVVISASAGGLGHILAQICKMKGCHVVAICGGPRKAKMLERLGCCDRIIDYRNEALPDILTAEYKDRIDIAFDSVGRDMFDLFLSNLAPRGRLVVIGVASELADSQFELVSRPRVYDSIYWKGASVRCFMNHLYKQDHAEARDKLFKWYQQYLLQVKVDESVFEGIESISEASAYLLKGQSCGKVIVKL